MFETIRKRERSLPAASVSAKYFWFVCVREDQAFLRDLQEFVLEAAGVDHRPFDQRRHFVKQRFRHHDLVALGLREQMRADGFLAVGKACDHMTLVTQRFRVRIGVLDLHEAFGQEAMAERGVVRVDAERGDRYDLFAVQCGEALRRTHKLDIGAVRTLIRHDFRNGQLRNG